MLIGTEAVLHRARRASLVVFLDFDQELLAPRYLAAEQAMALLVRAGRLVGPRNAAGAFARRVVVQTRLPGRTRCSSPHTAGEPQILAAPPSSPGASSLGQPPARSRAPER